MTEFQVPRNSTQAYGFAISAAVDEVERAYQEAALKKDATLCSTTADKLSCAVSRLREMFPNLPEVDVYASTAKLIPQLNFLYRALSQSEDSVVRQHMQAMVRARLYSSSVRARTRDLASDAALVSISAADNLPLALVLGENRFLPTGVYGVEPMTPSGIMEDGGRPFRDMEKVNINRRGAVRKIARLLEAFGPLVVRSPWARVINRSGVSTTALGAAAQVASNVALDDLSTPAGLTRFHNRVTPSGAPLANGQAERAHGWDEHHSRAYAVSRYQADGVIVADFVAVQMNTDGVGELHGTLKTIRIADRYFNLNFSISVGGAYIAIAIVRNGTLIGEAPIQGMTFCYREVPTTDADSSVIVWTLRGVPAGVVTARFDPAATGAAGVRTTLALTVGCPMSVVNAASLTDAERIEQILDLDMTGLMTDFFQLRNELVADSVDEKWYLQSYHSFVLGTDPAYTASVPLSNGRLTAIKAHMLAPETWVYMRDLTGFLNKVYDDLGSLLALVNATDFE